MKNYINILIIGIVILAIYFLITTFTSFSLFSSRSPDECAKIDALKINENELIDSQRNTKCTVSFSGILNALPPVNSGTKLISKIVIEKDELNKCGILAQDLYNPVGTNFAGLYLGEDNNVYACRPGLTNI